MQATSPGLDGAAPLPSATARWTLLTLLSLAMCGNYYVYDSIAPVADLLASERGMSDTQIGSLNAIYSLPNVFMVLVGGIVIDRIGACRGVALFAGLCALGGLLTAVSDSFFGMAAGRLVFGLGAESMIVGVTTAIGHWFKARHLGLALGLNLSLARGGSYAADLSPTWAKAAYDDGSHAVLMLAAVIGAASLAASLCAWFLEIAARRRGRLGAQPEAERFAWSDVVRFDRDFWLLVGLCVAIYSVLLPFRSTFAIKYLQDAHGLSREAAGELNGTVFLAAIFATPIFGALFDRPRRRTWALFGGSLLLLPVFPILIWTDWDPQISNVLLGLSYSLVPAVLWPCVARLVDARRLGTAYGLMTMIQNIGLFGANLGAGALNDAGGASPANPSGYAPMLVFFAILSLAAVVFAALLRRDARATLDGGS